MRLLELPDKHTQRMSPPDPCGVCSFICCVGQSANLKLHLWFSRRVFLYVKILSYGGLIFRFS